MIVYERRGGLTAADRRRIAVAALVVQPVKPGSGQGDAFRDAVQWIRDRIGEPAGGLDVKLTGAAGFSLDAIKVFGNINGTLLLVAAGIVLVLLIVIYRSPIFLDHPVLHSPARRGGRARLRLPAGRSRRHHQRAVRRHPAGARLRRRHRLRAAAGDPRRALLAPLLLVASVILSFATVLGTGIWVSDHIFGFPGVDPSLPLLAFVFLVALGIDYNIFLMARVRGDAQRYGTREGPLGGLAGTGAVITGAGIVLAGTFGALAVRPLIFLTQIGFIVAFGVLLDTFLVRSVIVPALVMDVGRRVWWPSVLARAKRGVPS